MTMTRTRLTLAAIVGALAVLALAACARGGGDGQSEAPLDSARPGAIDTSGYDPSGAKRDTAYFASQGAEEVSASEPASDVDGSPAVDPQLQGLLDRKIIQSTSVDIEVEEVGRNFQEIIRIAETAGGFVASSTFSNVDDQQVADLTIRVPGDRYQDVLGQIRARGVVKRESSDANDVTEEYTDLQARLRTLEATERRYLELLGQADEISDILLVQDRLDGVRGQIEQVQGRINLLEHLTDLATITVHLRPLAPAAEPPADGGPQPLEAAAAAWERSLDALRGLATAALVVAAFSWWLLPPLAVLAIGTRWWLSRHPHPATKVTAP